MSIPNEQLFLEAAKAGDLAVMKHLVTNSRLDVNWRSPRGLTPLVVACLKGDASMVDFLLRHPKLDVNKSHGGGFPPFFLACEKDYKDVVSLLLADMRLNPSKPSDTGATPFLIASHYNHKEVVSLLLADMRIDINTPNNYQCTPLWFASQNGHLSVVQLILASGREVDTKTKSITGEDEWNNKTAAEVARVQGSRDICVDESVDEFTRRKQNGPLIAALIDSFDLDPVHTRQQLREHPELRDSFISDLFALVVFLCDGLLTVGAESPTHQKTARLQRGCPWNCR